MFVDDQDRAGEFYMEELGFGLRVGSALYPGALAIGVLLDNGERREPACEQGRTMWAHEWWENDEEMEGWIW